MTGEANLFLVSQARRLQGADELQRGGSYMDLKRGDEITFAKGKKAKRFKLRSPLAGRDDGWWAIDEKGTVHPVNTTKVVGHFPTKKEWAPKGTTVKRKKVK